MPPDIVLVTGATGFLGRTLCPYLVERGHRVRALVRRTSDHAFLEPWGVERAWGDLRDPVAVAQAVTGCAAIIHAGARFRFWGEHDAFFAANVEGTHNLLQAARQAAVERFIHISTIGIVGHPPPGATVTEETPCTPQDAYQESKLEAERLVLSYHREHGLPAIILRLGALYGPGSHYAFNRLFFEDPLRRLPVQVHRGRHVIMPTFVRDAARAAEVALTRGRPGQVYNVCGPCLTHRQVGEVVGRLAGRRIRFVNVPAWAIVAVARGWTWLSRFTHREPYYPIGLYPYVFYDWPVSIEKAQREMGFEPTPFEEGAWTTLEWMSHV